MVGGIKSFRLYREKISRKFKKEYGSFLAVGLNEKLMLIIKILRSRA